MEKKIAIMELEYDDFITTLKKLHENNMNQAEEAIQKIQSLNTQDGGFYFTEITPKVDSLLTDIAAIKSKIEEAYGQIEEIIEEFLEAVDGLDSMS